MAEGDTGTTPETPDYSNKAWFEGDEWVAVPGGFRITLRYVGAYSVLLDLIGTLGVGIKSDITSGIETFSWSGTIANVASARLERLEGDRARLTLTISDSMKIEYWSVEMAEIQKPIKTWMAGQQGAPDLEQIAQWEARKGVDLESYVSYKYNGADTMTGNTLKLAKMINEEGISNYSVHSPIAMRTTMWPDYPDDIGEGLDKMVIPSSREGWSQAGAGYNDASGNIAIYIAGLAEQWVKTADRITANQDGTWTRVEQWTGADYVNPDLYPTGTTI